MDTAHNTEWGPASGYRNKWRVTRYADGQLQEAETSHGRRILWSTFEAASRAAKRRNDNGILSMGTTTDKLAAALRECRDHIRATQRITGGEYKADEADEALAEYDAALSQHEETET